MYNIIELNDKLLSELKAIAKEMGLKKIDSLKKEDLVYKILDQQAIDLAGKKVASEKEKTTKAPKKKTPKETKSKKVQEDKALDTNEKSVVKIKTDKDNVKSKSDVKKTTKKNG